MAKRLIRAAGLIVFRHTNTKVEYLLVQHAPSPYGPGLHWGPPKGHVDEGEDELTTAFRETEEETGLARSQLELIEGYEETINYEVKRGPKIVRYWLAKVKGTHVEIRLSQEHQGFGWFELSKALEKIGAQNTSDAIKSANTFLFTNYMPNLYPK